MPKEQEGSEVPLTAIHINLKERSISFEAQEQTVARLTFASSGSILFQAQPSLVAGEGHELSTAQLPTEKTSAASEKEPTVTITGRLRDKPKEGKVDRAGHATAYARFAAHDPDRQGPHDYLATFHRHTVKIALGLAKDAQITVEGYPHPSQDEKRLDTFSVVNLLSYPGRPQKR